MLTYRGARLHLLFQQLEVIGKPIQVCVSGIYVRICPVIFYNWALGSNYTTKMSEER